MPDEQKSVNSVRFRKEGYIGEYYRGYEEGL